jgi:hypothetical protein
MTAARALLRHLLLLLAVCLLIWQAVRHYTGEAMSATWLLVVIGLIVTEFVLSD